MESLNRRRERSVRGCSLSLALGVGSSWDLPGTGHLLQKDFFPFFCMRTWASEQRKGNKRFHFSVFTLLWKKINKYRSLSGLRTAGSDSHGFPCSLAWWTEQGTLRAAPLRTDSCPLLSAMEPVCHRSGTNVHSHTPTPPGDCHCCYCFWQEAGSLHVQGMWTQDLSPR